MNKELFKAILSLDAYNRGYNAGIDFGINVDATTAYLGTGVDQAATS